MKQDPRTKDWDKDPDWEYQGKRPNQVSFEFMNGINPWYLIWVVGLCLTIGAFYLLYKSGVFDYFR